MRAKHLKHTNRVCEQVFPSEEGLMLDRGTITAEELQQKNYSIRIAAELILDNFNGFIHSQDQPSS